MKKVMKQSLNIIAACFSLISGLLWALSAHAQMGILDATGTNADEIAKQLNYISQHENLWAAMGAAGAGIALFLALLFE
jgi:hypothetical protein